MKSIFKICIVLLALCGKIHSQNWLWSKSQNINSFGPYGSNVRLGSSGNLVTYLYDNNNTHLVFTDKDGNVIWNKYFQNLRIIDIAIDGGDNIYFAGSFSTTANIPPGTFVSQGESDAIVGMFNSGGVLVKSKTFGTASQESAYSIALKGSDVFATGEFTQTQTIDAVTLTGNNSNRNTFVLKFDINLNAVAGTETQSQGSRGLEVAVDQNNSVYLLGESNTSLSIGTQSTYIAESGTYMAKLNNNLGITWLKTLTVHGANGHYRPFIYFDASGNFILGHIAGGGGGSDHALSVEKFDPNGTELWSEGANINTGNFLDVDNQDNIWIAGAYADFNGDYTFTLAKISTGGTYSSVISDLNIRHRVYGLAVKANNDLYITGYCDGASSLNGHGCSPHGSIFMARYAADATGINDKVSSLNTFNIYPNPSTGMITIKCTSGGSKNCLLSVKNTLGQVVISYPIKDMPDQFSKDIDISIQPKGIYFVELRSGDDKKVEKIVFQ